MDDHKTENIQELVSIAARIRGTVVEMSYQSKAAHLGSSLSCVDLLVAAYWNLLDIDPNDPLNPERDRFILSKGHAAAALFATLARRGFFDEILLDRFGMPGCRLEEHPGPGCIPGVEAATGSLGHGLSIGAGMALAARILGLDYRVCVLMSDGECNEGSVWEAAMFAAGRSLGHLCAIVDFNKWQATGRSCDIMALEPLQAKFESFGWQVCQIDGHDMGGIISAFDHLPFGSNRPLAVIAHTTKGKGVSFMEDDNNWHYRIPDAEEVHKAKNELGLT